MEVLHYTYGPYGYENHGFLQISADFPNKTDCFIGSFPIGDSVFAAQLSPMARKSREGSKRKTD